MKYNPVEWYKWLWMIAFVILAIWGYLKLLIIMKNIDEEQRDNYYKKK